MQLFKAFSRVQSHTSHSFSTVKVDSYVKFRELMIQHKYPAEQIDAQLKPALDIYQQLGFTHNILERIYRLRPESLLGNDIGEFSKYMATRLGFEAKHLKQMLFRHPQILGATIQSLETDLTLIQQKLQLTPTELRDVLTQFPYMLNKTLPKTTNWLIETFQNYAQFDAKQVGQLILNQPFLMTLDQKRMMEILKLLYRFGFNVKQVQKLLHCSAEFLSTEPSYFITLWNHFTTLVDDKQELLNVVANNPKLLLLDPHLMIGTKINILREEGLTDKQIGQLILVEPDLFIKSVSSLKLKIKYFDKQYQIKLVDHECFPQIAKYDYWTVVRPRLTIAKTADDCIRLFKMSEQEFIDQYNCQQEYQDLLKQKPNNHQEIDFLRRHFHRRYNKVSLLQ